MICWMSTPIEFGKRLNLSIALRSVGCDLRLKRKVVVVWLQKIIDEHTEDFLMVRA
jgi:hypothetical protein